MKPRTCFPSLVGSFCMSILCVRVERERERFIILCDAVIHSVR